MPSYHLRVAHSFFDRLFGLLWQRTWSVNEGLLLPRCKAIHTLAMRRPIGVFFMGGRGQVLRCIPCLKPWRIAYHRQAIAIIETPAFDEANRSDMLTNVALAFEPFIDLSL